VIYITIARPIEECLQASGDRFDRRERVVDLVTEHAHETTPRLQLLFAKRLRDVRENEQRMRAPILTKRSAPYFPSPRAARERYVHRARRFTDETVRETNLIGGSPEQTFGNMPEKALAGAVHEAQALVVIEREHGDVDVGHDRAKERGRLHRAEPLRAQRFAE